eukprot:g455.t1
MSLKYSSSDDDENSSNVLPQVGASLALLATGAIVGFGLGGYLAHSEPHSEQLCPALPNFNPLSYLRRLPPFSLIAPVGPAKKGSFFEYSVIYTDRVYNMLSPEFQASMRRVSKNLKEVYHADAVALIPGSGTYAMESVARQFGTNERVMVIRNGYFSYRWSDIFEVGQFLAGTEEVLLAHEKPGSDDESMANTFSEIYGEQKLKIDEAETSMKFTSVRPPLLENIISAIVGSKPRCVFAPHVETSTGMLLPDSYLKAIADAVHEYGGIFVLDCIASGNVWVDMEACGVDVIISAPQKGWTGPACVGIVMLSERAAKLVRDRKSSKQPEGGKGTSFCCNLYEWLNVMDCYVNADGKGPGCRYYTTLPTDAIMKFDRVIEETRKFGFQKCRDLMFKLGYTMRKELAARGFQGVARVGFQSPGVVVVYSTPALLTDASHKNMVVAMKGQGIQIAGGVPWKLGEERFLPDGKGSKQLTFRIGLFGLDKLQSIDATVSRFLTALDKITA